MYPTFQDRRTKTTQCQVYPTLAYTEQQSYKMMQHITQNGFRSNIFVIICNKRKIENKKTQKYGKYVGKQTATEHPFTLDTDTESSK